MEPTIHNARLLFNQQKFDEAIALCKEILVIEKDSTETLILIGKSMIALGEAKNGRFYFKKALNSNHNDFETIKNLGNSFQKEGDVNTAKSFYKKAIEINPSYAPALTNLGTLELKLGNTNEALSLLLN